MPEYEQVFINEYANIFITKEGVADTYDNRRLVTYPMIEPWVAGSGAHPWAYVIGQSGDLYMFKSDSTEVKRIASGVKHVAGYWNWCVAVFNDNTTGLYMDGKLFAPLDTKHIDIVQVAAAHTVLFRGADGSVWQYDWSKIPWKSGTVWYKPAPDLKAMKGKRVPLPGPATDITTSRSMHSSAIVDGEGYSWCEPFGAKFIGLKVGTAVPVNMMKIWGLTERIKLVRSSDHTTHVITMTGRAFGGGVNDLGEVGNGMKAQSVTDTGKWTMSSTLIVYPMVEVGRAGEVYDNIFKGNSYGHRTALHSTKGIIRFCGRNKYGLCHNGIYPEQPTDPKLIFEGMWSVPTFRRAVFPATLTIKTAAEGRAMIAAGTYPPKEPRVLVRTVTTQYFDDDTTEVSEVKAIE